MNSSISIRLLDDQDLSVLDVLAARLNKTDINMSVEPEYFTRHMALQKKGERQVFLAHWEGAMAGYCVFNRQPKYALYRAHGIPEIQDLMVLPDFRRRGLAKALIQHCENLARGESITQLGIGVGLHRRFGPAQALYSHLGYYPDGEGVSYDRASVTPGEFRPVDDQLCLMLIKDLL